ncbi:hypothetical protein B0H10DRAFT_2206189 [Mycena sp. CBHHK59/15]|nr:hypothetical protein B0H10DRAFT_2206189 [Mycena sp. CBHHK59/15]
MKPSSQSSAISPVRLSVCLKQCRCLIEHELVEYRNIVIVGIHISHSILIYSASASASDSLSASASSGSFSASSAASSASMSMTVPSTPLWSEPNPLPTVHPPKPKKLPPHRLTPNPQQSRAVSATQYHATCKTYADAIESRITGNQFRLLDRNWPDEFSWSGGFYLTPDRTAAERFGPIFRAEVCPDKGGVVVIEFNFNTNGLKVKEVARRRQTQCFRDTQKALATRIKTLLIQHFKGKTVWASEQPTQPQLQRMSDLGALGEWKPALEDIAQYDVVAASGGFIDKQKEKMAAALHYASIPSMQSPFSQVVLLNDEALSQLTFTSQTQLDATLQGQVTTWLEYLASI